MRKTKEGAFSAAFVDVFFNLMVIFLIFTLISEPSSSYQDLRTERNSKGSYETRDISVEIKAIQDGWLVKLKGKEVFRGQTKDVISWMNRTSPSAISVTIKSNTTLRDFLAIYETAQRIGTVFFYQMEER